jgi:hypothetical protein
MKDFSQFQGAKGGGLDKRQTVNSIQWSEIDFVVALALGLTQVSECAVT